MRKRRTKQQVAKLKLGLLEIISEYHPMTVRQVFYQAVSRGLIEKSEKEYKGTIVRLLKQMRRDGVLPWEWIADNTRWQRRPATWNSLGDMLHEQSKFYRRHLWANTFADVEIWLEKDALSGVLLQVTERYDVPLMVTRGYPSLTFLHTAANAMQDRTWPTYVYYLGDYDPTGIDIPRMVESNLREMAPQAEIFFEIVAVTPEQIEQWSLPTRPTKKTDTRSKNFQGESVEVDAISPPQLRQIAERSIQGHIDSNEIERLERNECLERETLKHVADYLDRGGSLIDLDR